MIDFVQLDPIYREDFIQMNIEYIDSLCDLLDINYQLDSRSMLTNTIPEMAQASYDEYKEIKPPNGMVLVSKLDEKIVGMGAVKRIRENTGEIKRMYNKPEYRGNGYGRMMLYQLLLEGDKLGFKSYYLDTPKFAYAAQGLYKSAGFTFCEPYPESKIGPAFSPYWLYMQKPNT
jgi:ribosomal protein S18 acetylase RimI-like enzyme